MSFLFGFFTLWLSLTILGVIGLGDADRALYQRLYWRSRLLRWGNR